MGVNDPNNSPNSQSRIASRIEVHPNYNPGTLINDIAIIRVSEPFSLSQNDINSLCLPDAGSPSSYYNQKYDYI